MKFTILVDHSLCHFYYILILCHPYPSVDMKRRRNTAFSLWPRSGTRTLSPGFMKFTVFVEPSLVIITIYLVCLIYAWEEKKHCISTIWRRPNTRSPSPGVMKFTIWLDLSLVIIIMYLVCLIYAWEYRRRNNAFSIYDNALAQEVMKCTILVDPFLDIIIIYLVCLMYVWEY